MRQAAGESLLTASEVRLAAQLGEIGLGCHYGVRLKAREMKTAIWSRLQIRSGW